MILDSIVAEVRQAREELAKRFNYDLRAMVQDARERQAASGRTVVTFRPGLSGKQLTQVCRIRYSRSGRLEPIPSATPRGLPGQPATDDADRTDFKNGDTS